MQREIIFFEDYFDAFYKAQIQKVRNKIDFVLILVSTVQKIPEKYFKHITGTDGIFEVRVEVGSDIFRVFSFFDKGKLIILVNGFQKKSQKTPKAEIEKAEKLKKEYLENKSENNDYEN